MKRKFVLPAALSLAFHAFLLFGFAPPARLPVALVTAPVKPIDPFVPVVIPEDGTPVGGDTDKSPNHPNHPIRPIDIPLHPQPRLPVIRPVVIPGGPGDITEEGRYDNGAKGPLTGDEITGGRNWGKETPSVLSELDNRPQITRQVSPVYPHEAVASALSGTVTVDFVVDEKGHVQDARVTHSTNTIFDDAAVQAVLKWRFERGLKHGRAVRFRMQVPLAFSIADEER